MLRLLLRRILAQSASYLKKKGYLINDINPTFVLSIKEFDLVFIK